MKKKWKRTTKKLTKMKEELLVDLEPSRMKIKKTKIKMPIVTLKAIGLDLAPDRDPNLPDRQAAEIPAVAHGRLVLLRLAGRHHLHQSKLRTNQRIKSNSNK
jgi:hypothetical protein